MALALKLSYFMIERAAEPVSEILERQAVRSTAFRSACTRLARWYNRLEYNKSVRRLALQQKLAQHEDVYPDPGHSHSIIADELEPPPVLSEKEATHKGAELLGEGFVISIGLILLLHQVASDRAEEAEQQRTIEENEERIRTLERQLAALSKKVDVAPESPPSPTTSNAAESTPTTVTSTSRPPSPSSEPPQAAPSALARAIAGATSIKEQPRPSRREVD